MVLFAYLVIQVFFYGIFFLGSKEHPSELFGIWSSYIVYELLYLKKQYAVVDIPVAITYILSST